MKRFIAILLVLSMSLSLCGCGAYVDTDELKEYAEEMASEALDELVEQGKEEVNHWLDEKKEQLQDSLQIPQTGSPDAEDSKGIGAFLKDLLNSKASCSHMPHQYKKADNFIHCKCGTLRYNGNDLDGLDIAEFAAYVRWQDKLLQGDKFCANAYLKFYGLNPVFSELLKTLEKETDLSKSLDKLEELCDIMEDCNVAKNVFINYLKTKQATDTANPGKYDALLDFTEADLKEFDDVFSTSLTVLSCFINLQQMMEAQDPFEACKEFIDAVKGPIGTVTSVTGGANTFLLVGLETLPMVLSAFELGYKDRMDKINFTATTLNPSDTILAGKWSDIYWGESYWKKNLTYEHILGTKKNSDVKLPSLPEALDAQEFNRLSVEGQYFVTQYILFCLDEAFEEALGITYKEYIEFIGYDAGVG